MKRYSKHNSTLITLLASLTLFIPILLVFPNMVMADVGRPVKARVKAVAKSEEGVVSVKAGSGGTWATLHRCERVGENDEIETGEEGWVELKLLYNDDMVEIGKNSYLKIVEMKKGIRDEINVRKYTESEIELTRGMVRVIFYESSDSTMTVNTANAEVKIVKADCIVQYDASLKKTTVTVNVAFAGGYALVTPEAMKGHSFKVSEKDKIEITGDESKKIKTKEESTEKKPKEEKPKVDANKESRDFVRKFVDYLNSESTSGIRGMVSSRYGGNIGGFGSKSALLRGLGDYFDDNKSVRLSYSVGNAGLLGDEIILNATINGNSVKFWLKKDGSSYRLGHAEGRWFFD